MIVSVICVGDEMLREPGAGCRTRSGCDVVARLGGDEYLVLLEPVASERRGSRSPSDWRRRWPARSSGAHEASIGASVGAAFSLDGSTDADRLLAQADAAVYRAKSGGRGRVEVFDESLRRELTIRGHSRRGGRRS